MARPFLGWLDSLTRRRRSKRSRIRQDANRRRARLEFLERRYLLCTNVWVDGHGDASEDGTSGYVSISRDSTSGDLYLDYTVGGSATSGTDYSTMSGSVYIPDGSSSASISISAIDDSEVEGDETIDFSFYTSSSDVTVLSGSDSATVTITDNDTTPTVSIYASDANAAEAGPDDGELTVERDGATTSDLTVYYYASGTATDGSDYNSLSGSVTIPSGSSSTTITVTPVDDSEDESDETVEVSLTSGGTDYSVATGSDSATVTIADNDDTPTVSIYASDAGASEDGPDDGEFTVERDGATASDLTVYYFAGGTATDGSDYNSLSGSVTIPNGSSSTTITVTPVDDSEDEGDETVEVSLTSGGTDYSVATGSDSATVTIADNDDTPTVSIYASDASASEDGPDDGEFTVERDGATTSDLTVYYFAGGTATDGSDYNSLSGSVTIPSGSSSTTITVTPVDDSEDDDGETVEVSLTSGGTDYSVATGSDSATVTITDNDDPIPSVSVYANDSDAAEDGPDTGQFTISRDGPTTAALTVNYTMGGDATNGSDYTTLGGSVSIPVGSSSTTVTITPIDDGDVEEDEDAVITLTSDTAYTVAMGSDSATVTIESDDVPSVSIYATDADAAEVGPDTGTFTVTRNGPTTNALTVQYSVGGAAESGSDYNSIGSNVTIPAGSSSTTITVTPINDGAVEGDEDVDVTLSSTSDYTINNTADEATVTIESEDLPTVSIYASDGNAAEVGPDTGEFTVTRDGPTTSALTVQYSVGGDAAAGSDYNSIGSSVSIPAGSSSTTITVTPINDGEVEEDESVEVTLSGTSNYNIDSGSNSATVTIESEDVPTVTIYASDSDAAEDGPDNGEFTITRDGPTTSALTVNFSTGGSATSGDDYNSIGTSATIPVGSNSTTITVTPVDDADENEGDESVVATLSPASEYTVASGSASATVTIENHVNCSTPQPAVPDPPPPFQPGYIVAGNWDRLGDYDMVPEDYEDICTGETGTHEVNVEIHARRIFKTFVGDNTPANFHVELRFKVTTTFTSTDPVTMEVTSWTQTYWEYHSLPPGIFIRPTLNNYHDNYSGDLDAETFVNEYVAGAEALPPG